MSTIEDQLRHELREGLGEPPADSTPWTTVERRARGALRRRRRVGAAVVAAVLLITGVAVGAVISRSGNEDRTFDVVTSPDTTPATTAPDGRLLQITSTDLPDDQVVSIVGVEDGAWVTLWQNAQVVHVGRTGEIDATVAVGTAGQGPLQVIAGEGAVWALSFGDGDLIRIDPTTHQESGRVHLPAEPERMAAGNGWIWVTGCCDRGTPNQRLYRINPTTLGIDHELALPGQGEGQQVTINPSGIRIAGEQTGGIVNVDADGNAILSTIEAAVPCVLVATDSTTWCVNATTRDITTIAADGSHVTGRTPDPSIVGIAPSRDDQLLLATPRGIQLGDGTTFTNLGGPSGITALSFDNTPHLPTDGTLWVVSGNHLLQFTVT